MPFYTLEELSLEANWLLFGAQELAKNRGKERAQIRPLSERTFRTIFGVDSTTAKCIHYVYLIDSDYLQPRDLLWTLSFLKNYEVEPVSSLKFITNERTFRDTTWDVIYFLSSQMEEVFLFSKLFFIYIKCFIS